MNTETMSAIDSATDEVILAMLHFNSRSKPETHNRDFSVGYTQYDAKPFMPDAPLYFFDLFNEERLFSVNPTDLMADPSKQFERFEIIQSCDPQDIEAYRWNGMKIRKTRPRAFIRPGCDVFWDSCQRIVYKSGREDVRTHVFGWNFAKRAAISCPFPEHKNVIMQGRERIVERELTQTLTLMASIAEDVKVNWSVTIREETAFTIYSTEQKIKELCDLRDAPMTTSGRRAAICHWVRSHRRKTESKPIEVRKHLRGITQFPLAEMQITVAPPVGFNMN
jgi:hypothetical protein